MIESPVATRTKPARNRIARARPAETEAQTAVIAEMNGPLFDTEIQAEAGPPRPTGFAAAPNGLDGMADGISNLFDSFQKLAGDPANFGRRRDVVRGAQNIAAQFNQASSRLKDLAGELDAAIQKDDDDGSVPGKFSALGGTLATLQNGLDKLASHLITRVNAVYQSGRDLNGGTGRNFFTGTSAADIGVNIIVAIDPAQLQVGGAAGTNGDHSIAAAVAELGRRDFSGIGHQTFAQSCADLVAGLPGGPKPV